MTTFSPQFQLLTASTKINSTYSSLLPLLTNLIQTQTSAQSLRQAPNLIRKLNRTIHSEIALYGKYTSPDLLTLLTRYGSVDSAYALYSELTQENEQIKKQIEQKTQMLLSRNRREESLRNLSIKEKELEEMEHKRRTLQSKVEYMHYQHEESKKELRIRKQQNMKCEIALRKIQKM